MNSSASCCRNIAVIGGGAAGFFAAINLKEIAPHTRITLFERNSKVLAKVAVSGGGRCNLTNSFEDIKDLKTAYPRGHRLLKRLFKQFDHKDAFKWFENHGVKLVTQSDHCVFPQSQDAHTIIQCFLYQANKLDIDIRTSHAIEDIVPLSESATDKRYKLIFSDKRIPHYVADKVIITTGGSSQINSFNYLQQLGHAISAPVPSLFTFNIPHPITKLMGTVTDPVMVTIPGTKFKSSGALLITHWGMSGPAILKLSSYAARFISENRFCFTLSVNWINQINCDRVAEELNIISQQNPQKKLSNIRPYNLSTRMWQFLLSKIGFGEDKKWSELGRKGINKLTQTLTGDEYSVNGKGAFRDEFVTCGGVSLDSIHLNTLESKACKGIFFAGEVLDIDAITGGFNFQAAWTTGYTVAHAIASLK